MAFGGLAPFPLRLGSGDDESVSPEQWIRLCDDVAGQMQPLLAMVIEEPVPGAGSDGPCAIYGRSMGGTDLSGITCARVTVSPSVNRIDINLGEYYVDPTTGEQKRWKPLGGLARRALTGTNADFLDLSSSPAISISYTSDPADEGVHTLVLWGVTTLRESGDYGAEPTKAAAAYEGSVPYAYIWLTECRGMRGSAYVSAPGSFVEMENIAMARAFGFAQRVSERHAWHQLPSGSDQTIGRWARLLDVGTTGDKDWQARRKCTARFALIVGGPSELALNDAMVDIFGPSFVAIRRFPGTLDAPPVPTYWPGVNEGPTVLDISGDGAWSSQRYHFVVQLTAPNAAARVRLLGIAHRDADELFSSALVPVCTWDYSFTPPEGFPGGGYPVAGFLVEVSPIGSSL